ncbi:MAG: hypothetical protein CME64_09755 [Halobacteriovoraceae bacterium]|nr:hypothetical protein [Halobacteriovoraceae bacterium]|tara:strand:- start:42625 stop:43356 length:732 start_codon:yes stop_codon:yes gene_type:complete
MAVSKFTLTIDGGNTLTKYALFDGQSILIEKVDGDLSGLIARHSLSPTNTTCACVNVARNRKELSDFKVYDVSNYFKDQKFLEMPVNYSETLGLDRLILAYLFFSDEKSVALVDSGTFTTVDLVTPQGFQGGFILPGLGLLLDTYSFGFNLDKYRPKDPNPKIELMPRDSQTAMSSGLMCTFIEPIRSILAKLSYDELHFTGGNGEKLFTELRNDSFQQCASILFNPDLIHKALLKFLEKVKD